MRSCHCGWLRRSNVGAAKDVSGGLLSLFTKGVLGGRLSLFAKGLLGSRLSLLAKVCWEADCVRKGFVQDFEHHKAVWSPGRDEALVEASLATPSLGNSIIHDPALSEGNRALITEQDGSPDWRSSTRRSALITTSYSK